MSSVVLEAALGGSLTFEIKENTRHETTFFATAEHGDFRGRVEASTHMIGSPSSLFEDIAKNWQGWSEPKKWRDMEDRLQLLDQESCH